VLAVVHDKSLKEVRQVDGLADAVERAYDVSASQVRR